MSDSVITGESANGLRYRLVSGNEPQVYSVQQELLPDLWSTVFMTTRKEQARRIFNKCTAQSRSRRLSRRSF